MLDAPDPLSATFLFGIASGGGIAAAVWWARRWRARLGESHSVTRFTVVIPGDFDDELRARSRAFAEATGRPAAAPFVYGAMRDRTITRLRNSHFSPGPDGMEP